MLFVFSMFSRRHHQEFLPEGETEAPSAGQLRFLQQPARQVNDTRSEQNEGLFSACPTAHLELHWSQPCCPASLYVWILVTKSGRCQRYIPSTGGVLRNPTRHCCPPMFSFRGPSAHFQSPLDAQEWRWQVFACFPPLWSLDHLFNSRWHCPAGERHGLDPGPGHGASSQHEEDHGQDGSETVCRPGQGSTPQEAEQSAATRRQETPLLIKHSWNGSKKGLI